MTLVAGCYSQPCQIDQGLLSFYAQLSKWCLTMRLSFALMFLLGFLLLIEGEFAVIFYEPMRYVSLQCLLDSLATFSVLAWKKAATDFQCFASSIKNMIHIHSSLTNPIGQLTIYLCSSDHCVKVSVFEAILVRIQSECGNIRTRITPNTDTFCAVDIDNDIVDADCRYLRQSQIHLIISQVSVSLFFLFLSKNAILNYWKNPLTSKFHHQNFYQRFFGTVISLKPTIKLLNKLLKFLINCRLKSVNIQVICGQC